MSTVINWTNLIVKADDHRRPRPLPVKPPLLVFAPAPLAPRVGQRPLQWDHVTHVFLKIGLKDELSQFKLTREDYI